MKDPRKEPQNRLSLRPGAPDAEEPQDYGKMLVTGLSMGGETKPAAGTTSDARKNTARKNTKRANVRQENPEQESTEQGVYLLPPPMPRIPVTRGEVLVIYARQQEERRRARPGPLLTPFGISTSDEPPLRYIDDPAFRVLCWDRIIKRAAGGKSSSATDEEADAREGVRMAKKSRPGKMDETIGILELMEEIPDERAAIEFLEECRWGDVLFCPHCGSTNAARTGTGKPMSHRCYHCKRHFSIKTGTLMARSQLPLRKWIMAIYLVHTHRKGINSYELAKQLKITHKTAWYLLQRIRKAMEHNGDWLIGEVEVDETYFGGKESRKHANKKYKTPEAAWAAKLPVIGFKDRTTGRIVAYPIATATTETLEGAVRAHVSTDAKGVYTDGHVGYQHIDELGYNHGWVNHSNGEYVGGPNLEVYTQGIESFWSLMKRGYMGVYHYMSPKHLHRYCDEYAYRESVGKGNDLSVIAGVFERMQGKDLPYKKLIDEETSVEDRRNRRQGNRTSGGAVGEVMPDGTFALYNEDGTIDYV